MRVQKTRADDSFVNALHNNHNDGSLHNPSVYPPTLHSLYISSIRRTAVLQQR